MRVMTTSLLTFTVTLTNTSPAANGGFITAFAFIFFWSGSYTRQIDINVKNIDINEKDVKNLSKDIYILYGRTYNYLEEAAKKELTGKEINKGLLIIKTMPRDPGMKFLIDEQGFSNEQALDIYNVPKFFKENQEN